MGAFSSILLRKNNVRRSSVGLKSILKMPEFEPGTSRLIINLILKKNSKQTLNLKISTNSKNFRFEGLLVFLALKNFIINDSE